MGFLQILAYLSGRVDGEFCTASARVPARAETWAEFFKGEQAESEQEKRY
jgi:hypothetical protein